jgi:hypothetical protein
LAVTQSMEDTLMHYITVTFHTELVNQYDFQSQE